MIARIGLGLAAVLLVMALFGSVYTVDEGERAVVLFNGRVSGVSEPGLHFKKPLVEDTVTISIRQENYRFAEVSAYSQDQQIGTLVLSVNVQPTPSEVARI